MRVQIHTVTSEVIEGEVELTPGELERLEFSGTLTCQSNNSTGKFPVNLAQVMYIVRASS